MTGLEVWAAVDFALRASAVTLSLLIAIQFARLYRAQWFGRFGVLVGLGAAAYLVCPFLHEITFWSAPLRLLCVLNPALLWLFGRALFDDNFSPRAFDWAVPGLLLLFWVGREALGAIGFSEGATAFRVGHGLVQIGCAVHLFWRVWADAEDDLVASRRQFRRVFVALGGGLLLVIALVELAIDDPDNVSLLLFVQALAVWTVTVWAALSLLRMDGFFDLPLSVAASLPPVADVECEGIDADALRIVQLVEEQKLFLVTGCTVGQVAEAVRMPEYRVRDLINRELGFRNFSDFLNRYRVDEAALRLSDPSFRRLPILSIALDVGFGSIGPFNRAFKAQRGMTPSEFRRSGRNT